MGRRILPVLALVSIVLVAPSTTPGALARSAAQAKAPTVSAVSPSSGRHAGGTKVTITGTGFSHVHSVKFGKTEPKHFTVVSSKKITTVAPAHVAGTVDVRVATARGTSARTSSDQFRYKGPKVGVLSFVAGEVDHAGKPTAGPARSSKLEQPAAVVVNPAGDVFIADSPADVVEEVTPAGTLSIYAGEVGKSGAGPVDGPATATPLGEPVALAIDSEGNLYISTGFNVVVEVTPANHLSIVAGEVNPATGSKVIPGPATGTGLGLISGLAVDASGDLYMSDVDNSVIEKVSDGTLSILAGSIGHKGAPGPGPVSSIRLDHPGALAAAPSGDLYFADDGDDDIAYPQVFKLSPGGEVALVAGNGHDAEPVSGPATHSPISYPSQLALDGSGDLYIGDTNSNCVVEKVTPAGILSIAAGVRGFPYEDPQPGPATEAQMSPAGVAVDPAGDLYIADDVFSVVEKVTFPAS